jgi:uncharacterized protein
MNFKCPICRKQVTRENPDFPFCSERCRIIDLGNWASEKYVVSTPVEIDPEDEDPGAMDRNRHSS